MTDRTVIGGSGRQVILSFVLFAAITASLVAAPGPDGVLGAFLAALMLAIADIDARRYIIPNELTGTAVTLALLRAGFIGLDSGWQAVVWVVLRAAAVTTPFLLLMVSYRRWRGRDGVGLGDVKLAAVAGAWLSLVTVFAAIELATLAALGAYVLNGALRKRPLSATALLPFGLFLAPAIWLGWLAEALLN